MMRLLFLCLLLPATMASSEESEGSGVEDIDDEDLIENREIPNLMTNLVEEPVGSVVDKTTGVKESSDQLTLIVIVAAVSVVALSVAAIVAVVLVRRHMHNRQQGIYSVPTEQGQKGAV